MHGYKGNDLGRAIQELEKKYKVVQDRPWKKGVSSPDYHHIEDLAHHPTVLGLFSAIVVQYFRIAIFSDRNGKNQIVVFETDAKSIIKTLLPIIISGILKWITYMAEQYGTLEFDDDVPKPVQILVKKLYAVPMAISILKTADNWYGHFVSDVDGSKSTPGEGTGIPGLFLSFLKEISMLPGIKDSELPELINKLYLGTKDSPLIDGLDLRTELTVFKEQKLPVIINELLVRLTYFVSRLVKELDNNELRDVNWKNVIPFYNRTIVRMITISTATMEVVDLTDAAIRGVANSGGTVAGFAANFVVRINFVGIGRCALACTTDAAMGLKKTTLEYAVASAEIAIVSDVTSDSIEKLELSKQNTRKKLDVLNAQTSELSEFKF